MRYIFSSAMPGRRGAPSSTTAPSRVRRDMRPCRQPSASSVPVSMIRPIEADLAAGVEVDLRRATRAAALPRIAEDP